MAMTIDELPHHRKIRAAGVDGPAVYGWYVAAINFARRQKTDGLILATDIPALFIGITDVPPPIREALERPIGPSQAGLWEPVTEPAPGWRIHDFLAFPHNRSRATLDSRAQGERARRRWRAEADGRPPGRPGRPPRAADAADPATGLSTGFATGFREGAPSVEKPVAKPVDAEDRTGQDRNIPSSPTSPPRMTGARGGGGIEPPNGIERRPSPPPGRDRRPVPKAVQLHREAAEGLPRTSQGRRPRATVASVLTAYRRGFTAKFGSAPVLRPRDADLVAELLRDHDAAEILTLLTGFFTIGTAWVRREGTYTLRAFRHVYSDLVGMQAKGDFA